MRLCIVVTTASMLFGCGSSATDRASAPARPTPSASAAATATTAATPTPVPRSQRDRAIPILMYHVVEAPPANAPFPLLYVSARDFERQMRWLDRQGYTGVTLRAAYDFWTRGVPLPRKPVVVSFDDGYRSVHTNALPVLRQLGWPGVLNLELRILDEQEEEDLTREMVSELAQAGWEIDSHTVNHPDLTTLSVAQLRDELVRSRRRIRRLFDEPADFLCYPGGRYNATVAAAARRAGYRAATTTEFGLARPDDLFSLDRVRIDGGDGLAGFVSKMRAL